MDIFPYLLLRIGGNSLSNIHRLNMDIPEKIVVDISYNLLKIEKHISSLCDEIYQIISNLENDDGLRNSLLNIKRSIYKKQSITTLQRIFLDSHLGTKLTMSISEIDNIEKQIKLLTNNLHKEYAKELIIKRGLLRKMIKNSEFQNGLVFSSLSLLERINRYANSLEQNLKKSDKQSELSAIKYLTRMSAKTSPFSYFTKLNLSRFSEKSINAIEVIGDQQSSLSQIRINNKVLEHIRGHLLSVNNINESLWLRINPTITIRENKLVFLTNSNNEEVFQKISNNFAIEETLKLFTKKNSKLTIKKIVKKLIDNKNFKFEKSELDAFIRKLIDYGLLEFNIGVSSNDPDWDIRLVEILIEIDVDIPEVIELTLLLRKLRVMSINLQNSDSAERKLILEEAYCNLRDISYKLNTCAGKSINSWLPFDELKKEILGKGDFDIKYTENSENVKKITNGSIVNDNNYVFEKTEVTRFNLKREQIFYEDVTTNVNITLDKNKLKSLIKLLNSALSEMSLFEGKHSEKKEMLDFFDSHFETNEVRLLTLYEEFYRNKMSKMTIISEINEHVSEIEASKEKENKILEIQNLKSKWHKNMSDICKTSVSFENQVNVSYNDLKSINPQKSIEDENCYGAFIQFYTEENSTDLKCVVNGVFSGYGKMFSRFVHLFDSTFLDAIKRRNCELEQGNLFVENCDASNFNANLHPPLMRFEIWMPSSQNSLPEDFQINVKDISVIKNKNGELALTYGINRTILYPFDLGFLGIRGRSNLFQLMDKLGKPRYLYLDPIASAANKSINVPETKETEKVHFRPRVTLESKIVIQRKAWLFSKDLLPSKLKNESDDDYFIKINLWKFKYKLPNEVFIKTVRKDELEKAFGRKSATIGLTRDSYKPQYISFSNPFLVTLFHIESKKVISHMVIEEMLPNSEQLVSLNNEKYVTEHLVEWTSRKGECNV